MYISPAKNSFYEKKFLFCQRKIHFMKIKMYILPAKKSFIFLPPKYYFSSEKKDG